MTQIRDLPTVPFPVGFSATTITVTSLVRRTTVFWISSHFSHSWVWSRASTLLHLASNPSTWFFFIWHEADQEHIPRKNIDILLSHHCTSRWMSLLAGLYRRNFSWSSSTLATWWEEPTHWKRPWCWERLRAGGEGGGRGWDGWMAPPTLRTRIWANCGS